MDSKRLKLVEKICNEVLELPLHKRNSFLDETCGDDSELRSEVDSLLEFDNTFDSFIDSSPNSLLSEVFDENENLTGKKFDRYKIISLLGKGGMGSVYLAEDTILARKVALKFLHNEYGVDANKLKRFQQEAKATSALNHPNILTVYEIRKVNDTNFITTEFIEGKTLRELISKKNSLSLKEILKIVIQISEAITQAHKAGIIHRDIKPENIMVRDDGYVKVLDFGLAKLFETENSLLSKESQAQSTQGLIKGTVSYMSPEQARGLKVDKRTDIWSFGVILYELLTNKTPFFGETLTDTLVSIIHEEPKQLNMLNPNLPFELSQLVEKSLKKDLDERYQNFEDLLSNLKVIKRNLDFAEHKNLNEISEEQETQFFDSSSTNQAISANQILSPNNLSSEMSPLIGRIEEINQISTMLQSPNIRLVTLTGIGGTGKTRTAKSVASTLINKFSDGVFFIDLSMVENPDLVISFIAKTLEIKEENDKSELENLKEFLKPKNILLVLDNFEQIVEASPQIGDLISASENLKILVTSRVRLQLSFENEVTIQPLEFPSEENLSVNELTRYPAIRLFIERAKSAKPSFSLTETNAKDVVEICQKLDGLPLAIELAAARIKLFAPKAILKRLENSLKLLTGGAKDLPERQQTMRQTISWSYDLLTDDEKRLLNRVSVFRGGFSIEATEEVAIFDEEIDLLDGLTSLVDKSLVIQKEQSDGEPRFRLLVVVKEFARERVTKSNELFETQKQHANFFMEMAKEIGAEFEHADDKDWFDKIEIEIDNFRSALEWSLKNNPITSLQIASSLGRFWINRGYFIEGERWIKEGLEKIDKTVDPRLIARASAHLGNISWRLGNLEAANLYCEKSLQTAREVGNKITIVRALEVIGQVKLVQNEVTAASNFFEEGYNIVKKLNLKYEIANLANNLGNVTNQQNKPQISDKYYDESLTISRELGYRRMAQIACVNLAGNKLRSGEYEKARSYSIESLEIANAFDDKIGMAYTFEIFLALAVVDGKFEKAIHIGEVMYGIYEEANYVIEFYEKEQIESYLEKARAKLGEEELKMAKEKGRQMSIKDAVALALS